nr:hypothetical protein [Blastocatellia bacterium]
MNDLLHPTLERMVTLEINFYCKGKIIGTSMSAVSPNYTAGDTIELQLHPTERDLRRAPRKIERTFYIIDRVHHVIKETGRPSRAVLL